MEDLEEKRAVFCSVYSPNTLRARKEMSKSVFVATSLHDFKLFSYHSAYEIKDAAALLMAKNPLLLAKNAIGRATQMLTGLTEAEYLSKVDALFLSQQSAYEGMHAIWENMNFTTPNLTLDAIAPAERLSAFLPRLMLKRGVCSIRKASFFSFRNQSDKEYSPLGAKFFDPRSVAKTQEQNPKAYETRILESFWNFQKKSTYHHFIHSSASALYHAKYSKEFINLHQHSFFNHASTSPDAQKFGVSLWAELAVEAPAKSQKAGLTRGTLSVTCAKSYVNGESEAVAALCFDYDTLFYKDIQTRRIRPATNASLEDALGEDIYRVLSQQFYPLFGINARKGEGVEELNSCFTYDEGERGAILNLKEIYVDEKYSDKIIPELIRAIYDLVNFNSGSTFPLFSCMVDGDVIVNEELFPLIKSPLCTLISAQFLHERMKKSKRSLEFFSQYKANARHYYNSMTFDPLRPIFVY